MLCCHTEVNLIWFEIEKIFMNDHDTLRSLRNLRCEGMIRFSITKVEQLLI